MASAFGRGSPEHTRVVDKLNLMRGPVLLGGPPPPDEFPAQLRRQLECIEEYVNILAQRAADEAQAAQVVPAATEVSAVEKVSHLLGRFSRAAKHLKTRRTGRPPLLMADEYDVQYLLQAFLVVHFDDVRVEDAVPSVAGSNSRIDFILPGEQIGIEAKRARDTLRDKEVGEELLTDIARYKKHIDCKTLICFVYDPDEHVRNPDGLEKDLSGDKDGLKVIVVVRPKH
jgi:hypothetical protein